MIPVDPGSDAPASFEAVLDELTVADDARSSRRATLNGSSLLSINEKRPSVEDFSRPSYFDAAYADVSEPSIPDVSIEEILDYELTLRRLDGNYSALRALRRKVLRRLHPDIAPEGFRTRAIDLLKRINVSIDQARAAR